jgi:hypothetical protein
LLSEESTAYDNLFKSDLGSDFHDLVFNGKMENSQMKQSRSTWSRVNFRM